MGADREPAAVREGARLHREGQGRGRDGGLRWRGGASWAGSSSSRRVHRRRARRHRGARGGLRPGDRRVDLPHRGGGAQARQRHPLRAGRLGVDPRRAARPPGRRQAARRHGVGQRLPGGRPDVPVRRLRAQRPGPGERRRRASTSTPRPSPCGWSSPGRPATRSSSASAARRSEDPTLHWTAPTSIHFHPTDPRPVEEPPPAQPRDQPDVQRPEDEAGAVRHELSPTAWSCPTPPRRTR